MTRTKVFLILQTMLCLFLVIALSATAVSLFRDGTARKAENPRENIYTREIVAERVAPFLPLFFVSLGMLISGLLLGICDETEGKPVGDAEVSRDLVVAHVMTPSGAMKKEQQIQRKLLYGGWAVFALCMVPVAVYMTNPAHFPEADLEGMFYALLRVFLPCTCAGICVLVLFSGLREKSVLRETEAAREQLKAERAERVKTGPARTMETDRRGMIQAVLIVLAIVFIVMGIFNQSARDVLYKAITICTECVGLG